MFNTVSVLTLGFLILGINCNLCKNITCPIIPQHYRELGCISQKNESDCCESRFVCHDFKSLNINKCHFNGKEYEVGDMAPYGFSDPCESSCFCISGNAPGNPAHFECSELTECPALKEFHLRYCVHEHKAGVCCPELRCPEQPTELGDCILDGKTYKIGETMISNSFPCYTCTCSESFDNSTIVGNKACTAVNRGFARSYIHYFQMGCVPLYFESYGCCTVAFRCPNENDVVKQTSGDAAYLTNGVAMQCTFGNLTMNLGEELNVNDPCLSCKCATPPLLHCIRKSNCIVQTNQNTFMNNNMNKI